MLCSKLQYIIITEEQNQKKKYAKTQKTLPQCSNTTVTSTPCPARKHRCMYMCLHSCVFMAMQANIRPFFRCYFALYRLLLSNSHSSAKHTGERERNWGIFFRWCSTVGISSTHQKETTNEQWKKYLNFIDHFPAVGWRWYVHIFISLFQCAMPSRILRCKCWHVAIYHFCNFQ